MSENSSTESVEPDVETTSDDTATSGNDTATSENDTDSWGEDFDAAKAKSFITKLRRSERDLKRRLDQLAPLAEEAEKARLERLSENERLSAEADGVRSQMAAMQTRVASAEAKAIAASKKFADAGVGVRLLGDLGQFVRGDGDVDVEQIETALDELLVEHPYLARPDDGPRRMKENPAQGRAVEVPTADHGIREAESRGDYQAAAHLKADQLLALRNQTQ